MAGAVSRNKYQMDMCKGPLIKQIITFAVPYVFSGLMQIFFHATDLMVVGQFSSHRALAAIGATGSLTLLIINIFLGLSVGTNVVVARHIGAKNRKQVSRSVHTAILTALCGGVGLGLFGVIFSKTFLRMMDTPADIIDMSATYMRIYFAGLPVVLVYNYGSSILRAAGDTRRPLYFLIIGGIINVLFNLFFVLVCKMDVAGVAIATVMSLSFSAFMILRTMRNMSDGCSFRWKKLAFSWPNLKEIMRIGIPAGFQGACFSIANIMIQSSLNSFGSDVIAGNTVAAQCETFLFISSTSFGQAAISFVSQNLGGKQYKRIRKTLKYCLCSSITLTLGLVLCLYIFRINVLSLFNTNPAVIAGGLLRFSIILPFLWICCFMEMFISTLRGLGYSAAPTIIMIIGICIYRIIWNETVFRMFPQIRVLLFSYPISWTIVAVGAGIYCFIVLKKITGKSQE